MNTLHFFHFVTRARARHRVEVRGSFPPRQTAAAAPVAASGMGMKMRRGDIYRADLDPVLGSEQGGVRPVLIVQNDLGNLTSPTVIVAPLTSRSKKKTLRTHVTVDPPEGGLSRPSQVLCEQVRTLEKSRLSLYLGRLSADTLRRVDEALEQALGTRR